MSAFGTKFYLVLGVVLVIFSGNAWSADANPTPIVLWHGMGDTCCIPFSLGKVKTKLNGSIPGVYVLSLEIGDSFLNQMENGYFLHPDEQIKMACDIVQNDPQLANGYNAIGYSQGAQLFRGLIQRCPKPRIKNFISMGGQHQGVYGLPRCDSLSSITCNYIRKLLNYAAYYSWVQKSVVQSTYWHDPLNEADYKNHSSYLADINNERQINQTYIENLQSLENFVLVKFENDTVVQPIETEWFGYYKPGQAVETETLEESSLYLEDRLGLKQMKENNKLKFISNPGKHVRYKWDWFEANVVDPYLRN